MYTIDVKLHVYTTCLSVPNTCTLKDLYNYVNSKWNTPYLKIELIPDLEKSI